MARSRTLEVQTPGEVDDLAAEEVVEESTEDSPADAAPGQLRAADVDPAKIRRAVLTADGWVCPATLPGLPVWQ